MQKPGLRTAPGKIMWLAITVGFFIDTTLSALIGLIAQAVDPTVVGVANSSTFGSTTGIVLWVSGILTTGVGGYAAARIAKRERVLHGVMVGGVGLFMMLFSTWGDSRVAYNALDLSLQFLATVMGGLGGALSAWLPTRQDDV